MPRDATPALHRAPLHELERALAGELERLRRDDPLRRVDIVVGSALVCHHLRLLAASGDGGASRGHANLHIETIHGYASRLAAPALARRRLRKASDLARERLVVRLVRARAGRDWYFAPVAGLPGLPVALMRTLDDLREACVTPDDFEAFARETGGAKLRDLAALYGEYVRSLRDAGLYDDAELYAQAVRTLEEGDERRGGGLRETAAPALAYGLYDVPEMQLRLLAALRPRLAAVFVPDLVPPTHAAGGSGRGRSGEGPTGAEGAPQPGVADRLLEVLGFPTAGVASGPAPDGGSLRIGIVSVPDERAQRVQIVRELVGAADGVAFHEMAVVMSGARERAALARTLTAAGVPVAASGLPAGASTAACRALLDCLVPVGGRVRLHRVAVLELASATCLKEAPPADVVARWDRITRRARVVDEQSDWPERLDRLERRLRWRLQRPPDRDDDGDAPRRDELQADLLALESLRVFVVGLAAAARALPARASWPAMSAALLRVLDEFMTPAVDDPARDTLRLLSSLAAVEEEVTRDDAAAVARRLLDAAESARGRVGRAGVALLSPHQVRGLRFDTVVVADLAEKGFPGRLPPDTILLDGERERLAEALGVVIENAERREALARALLALVLQAARERAVLVYPRLDAGTGSPRLPSRLLLDVASSAAGRRVGAEVLERAAVSEGDDLGALVRRLPAAALPLPAGSDGHRLPAADRREVDLTALLDRRRLSVGGRGAYLSGAFGRPVAARSRAVLGAPHSALLTPYDGLIGRERAEAAVRAFVSGPVSPTALQRYIDCPFGFYARYLLGVSVDEEPERTSDIEPFDLGSVVHGILERLFRHVADDPEVGLPEALALLPDIVAERARQAERDGLTGFALAWNVKQRQILADLTRAVLADPVWEGTMRPAFLEWSFGIGDVPPVEVEAGDLVVSFAGRADRFDLSPDGRAAALVDYKTGKGSTVKRDLKQGIDIQLRVYRLAAALLRPPPADVAAEYRLVTRRGDFGVLSLDEDGDETVDALKRVVGAALAGMRAGVFPRWRESDRRCSYCHYEPACAGRAWVFDRKKDDERLTPLRRLKEKAGAASG